MYNVADPFQDDAVENFTYIDADPGLYDDGVMLDVTPNQNGPAYSNVDNVIADIFFIQTDYKGAFAANENWLDGWGWASENGLFEEVLSNLNDGNAIGFSLKGNFPNPFTPSTSIHFTLSKSSNVEIEFFDIYGNRLDYINSGYMNPGKNEIQWDINSSTDKNISSGIILYKLKTDYDIYTGKMTLLK